VVRQTWPTQSSVMIAATKWKLQARLLRVQSVARNFRRAQSFAVSAGRRLNRVASYGTRPINGWRGMGKGKALPLTIPFFLFPGSNSLADFRPPSYM
jgi:hypothetical protein